MANTNVNKVVLGNEVLIDLSNDTVSASDIQIGKKAHGANGESITGTASMVYNASTEELSVPDWMVVIEDV